MPTSAAALDRLKRQQPEWAPWLAVVDESLRETGNGGWDAVVPLSADAIADAGRPAGAPLLAGAALSMHGRSLRKFVSRLIRVGVSDGTPAMKTLKSVLDPDLDVLTMFSASLCQDSGRITEIADRFNADADALQAVSALVPMPFLQACQRRWASSIPKDWIEGYCPLCGAWPTFAEVRGIERDKYYRCGRCGAQWHARPLCCPYCAMNDHNQLVRLVPETAQNARRAQRACDGAARSESKPASDRAGVWGGAPAEREGAARGAGVPASDRAGVWGGAPAEIDACNRCRGYVKTFTRLQGCPADEVLIEDLASVALDLAALEQGYSRRSGAGYALDVTVGDNGTRRRFVAWNL